VFNAVTGAGKTETALYIIAHELQIPTLITVPTNKLRRQWYQCIERYFGREWCERYVGHIQQNKMDYKGRLIVLGLAPSLAFRTYPPELCRYFGCLWGDEFHKIGAPRMSQIFFKYPAAIRVGGTATNRRDALRKMCDLHMGVPRVKSRQEVMKPLVHVVSHRTDLPAGFEISSPFTVRSFLARSKERNQLLARLIYERGFLRGRNVLFLSDDTRQLQRLQEILVHTHGVPPEAVGLIVGEYYTGRWRTTRTGNRVKEKLKMTEKEQDRVAAECQIVGATYGIFDTGADVARLDMGVECTPRSNVRQAMGRVQRLMDGKPTVEWYSIFDQVFWYDPDALAQSRANGSFAAPVAPQLEKLKDPEAQNRQRMASFNDQGGRVVVFKGFDNAN
jgi:superfamily II DNA or RNA helicase